MEISKGSKVKYELDKETGLIKVSVVTPWSVLTSTTYVPASDQASKYES